jgi:hypothetical protein
MTNLLLMVLVLGVLPLALGVDVGAVVGWLRRRSRQRVLSPDHRAAERRDLVLSHQQARAQNQQGREDMSDMNDNNDTTKDVAYLAAAAYMHDIDPANISALEQFVRERFPDASEQFVATVAQRMRENHERIASQPMEEGLQAAIAVMGGRVELARSLGIKYRAVLDWRRAPAERLVQVERITGIPRQRLRPGSFPRKTAAMNRRDRRRAEFGASNETV